MFARGEDGEQAVGEHRQQRPAPPGQPAADLVPIQAGQALAALKGLLDRPASGDRDQLGQPRRGGCLAAVEGQLAAAPVAANEQPPAPRAGGVGIGPGRGVSG